VNIINWLATQESYTEFDNNNNAHTEGTVTVEELSKIKKIAVYKIIEELSELRRVYMNKLILDVLSIIRIV